MKVAGDLLFKAADFPMAEEVAERLHRTIDPSILGDGPSPQVKQMTAQMKHMGDMVEQLSQALKDARGGLEVQKVDIQSFDAETKRIVATGGQMDPADIAAIAASIAHQALSNPDPMQQAPQPIQSPPQGTQPPAGM